MFDGPTAGGAEQLSLAVADFVGQLVQQICPDGSSSEDSLPAPPPRWRRQQQQQQSPRSPVVQQQQLAGDVLLPGSDSRVVKPDGNPSSRRQPGEHKSGCAVHLGCLAVRRALSSISQASQAHDMTADIATSQGDCACMLCLKGAVYLTHDDSTLRLQVPPATTTSFHACQLLQLQPLTS